MNFVPIKSVTSRVLEGWLSSSDDVVLETSVSIGDYNEEE